MRELKLNIESNNEKDKGEKQKLNKNIQKQLLGYKKKKWKEKTLMKRTRKENLKKRITNIKKKNPSI